MKSKSEGVNIWRERFRQMAEKSRENPIIINGVEKLIARIEKGREMRDRFISNACIGAIESENVEV